MGEQELGIHEQCTAHSGIENKNSTVLWLLGILISLMIVIGGAQFAILLDVKSQLSAVNYRFTSFDEADKGIKENLTQFENRLQGLELRLEQRSSK